MNQNYAYRWEIKPEENIIFPTEEERKAIKLGSCGNLDTNFERLRKIHRICFNYGYSLESLITHILEKLTDEDIDNLLFEMDSQPRIED